MGKKKPKKKAGRSKKDNKKRRDNLKGEIRGRKTIGSKFLGKL